MHRVANAASRVFPLHIDCDRPRHGLNRREDMTWREYLVSLLNTGASLEHALLVQYLYAAYSLGGEQVPAAQRHMVKQWQEHLLAIAREEMGHFLTVQNIFMFLGAPLSLARNNFPLTSEWFSLEPVSAGSLACYVYAEMPDDLDDDDFPEKAEIIARANEHLKSKGVMTDVGELYPVSDVYSEIMCVLSRTECIPEAAFHPESYSSQASWDDWGRGYQPGPRPLDPDGNLIPVPAAHQNGNSLRAHVLIDRVATRTQALAALKALSVQGEGPHGSGDEPSHFDRLLHVYKQYKETEASGWHPTLPIPTNPATISEAGENRYISSATSRDWAYLFNVRYRILLAYLAHTFQLARVTRADEPSVRAMVMHRVFAEMYNLKTLAGILVHLPLTDNPHDLRRAGPPFELPYNQALPVASVDTWRLHLENLNIAGELCGKILASETRPDRQSYLRSLLDLDAQTTNWVKEILAGLSATEGYPA